MYRLSRQVSWTFIRLDFSADKLHDIAARSMLSKYLSHGYRGNCGSLCCYSFYRENAVNERGVNVKRNASVEIKGSIGIGIL